MRIFDGDESGIDFLAPETRAMSADSPKSCRVQKHPGEPTGRGCLCGQAHQYVRDLQPGERRFFLSRGDISMVDLAVELTHQIGDCEFKCAVWTSTKASIEQIAELAESRRIRKAQWILCSSQRSMNDQRLQAIINRFGVESLRVAPLHAKLMTLRNDDWSIVVQSSANMTENRSVEQFDVTDNEKLCQFVGDFFDGVFDEQETLDEEPPFDKSTYSQAEKRLPSMCIGEHFAKADVWDVSPIGVTDGLT